MESLSRPFQSRKLSNDTKTKHPYDGVFSGNRNNYAAGATAIDYREIFGSSTSSSIPVLDLSTLAERSSNMMLLNSKPDYSNIFGSPRHHHHDHVAVSYQQLFDSDKFRPPSSTTSSHDSDDLSRQSSDGLKQFNMSYNKISPKSKDGLDGTKHVTQLHAVPGFTRFIDEQVSPPKMKSEKHKLSPVNLSMDSSEEKESVSEVTKTKTKTKTFDIDVNIHPSSKVSAPSGSPINVVNHKNYPKRSATMNSKSSKTETSPASFDEEVDVNSAASALKKAIEKAQESIRIAKESVGRKKKGLGNFSNKSCRDSLKVKNRTEDVTGATSSNVFPDFGNGEKLSVAKKVIDEMNGKIPESNKSDSSRVTAETESIPLDSAGKYQSATSDSEAVHTEKNRTEPIEVVREDQKINMVVDDYEGKIKEIKTSTGALEHQNVVEVEEESVERVEVDMFRESTENKDEVRLSNARESVEQSNNIIASEKVEDEKIVSEESNKCDSEARLNLLENEMQDDVFEQEDVENAENVESHKGIEDVCNWSEIENESEDDHDTKIPDEETNETFNDVSELETKTSVQTFDNKIEESKKSAQTYDHSLEESETTLRINCEMKQEDDHKGEKPEKLLDNTFVQEFEKMSTCDENVIEETDNIDLIHESCKVYMNDKNVETAQEVSDVTESMEGTDASEVVEVCETDNEDENELISEENDLQSESSSGTIDGVKIDDIIDNLADLGSENDVQSESSSSSAKTVEEESNTQLLQKEIPDPIKDSQQPQYGDKEDDIGEPGPSKVWGKEHFRRIDEETSRERENEKNRLAVNRAIREARERAFIEARERAERERAAVEKATEEVRQRMMADAREKVAKASATTKTSSERTSAQSKLRAERAAVERATSEARQRALEKAVSQKSVSDLNNSESALRTKAKLEKHNRIMERAAQALAEKEKRDLLAQKEQAERNRLAENLDADIKRWSNGKEGNLRALLSTLQFILGPESGWQAVSLTDIITSSAVKKAYRKATLCVHPDKLQQRGATIQHKYICEKVFDLLKAAWTRFNSEEK